MSSTSETLKPFVVGGSSAMLASSVCHPIDLAKVRLQLFSVRNPGAVKKPSFVGILSQMIKDDGIKSIYSGLSASLMRQMFYGTARIGLHRKISDDLQEKNEGKPISFGTKIGASMLSGSMAVCIGTPFDVCLVRMQGWSLSNSTYLSVDDLPLYFVIQLTPYIHMYGPILTFIFSLNVISPFSSHYYSRFHEARAR